MTFGNEVRGMMAIELDTLKDISQKILAPGKALIDLLPQAQALRELLEQQTNFHIDASRDIGDGETRLASGLAISPTLAAMCLREQFRTTAFIRGLHAAITDALRRDRPVRVLYAGCGPYALLALPLMTVFSPAQVRFTLLDVHQACLDSAMALIGSFGLADHVADSLCTDATRYRIPADSLPDVIASETMAVCLRNEPQVAITRNLLAQAPMARLVPQSVSIELGMVNWGKEHVLLPADHVGEIPQPERDRINLGKVFELDAANVSRWHGVTGDCLPAGRIRLPEVLASRYRPCLLTRIVVYGESRLQDYDCSLTTPQHLPGRQVFSGDETLQFQYRLGTYPELVYEVL